MIFDFKANRLVAIIGLLGLFGLVFTLMDSFQLNTIWIFLISLIYVFILAKYMKFVASNGYRMIHQKLFIDGDAKGYLEAVQKLYKGVNKKRDFEGVKLQNLIMAEIFSGDYAQAKEHHKLFLETFGDNIERHESVRFSKGMIETLLVTFDYDPIAFKEKYETITKILDSMKPESVAHVKENPYSIYYMLTKFNDLVNEEALTIEKVKETVEDQNVFLKTSILYALFNNELIDKKYVEDFPRESNNTMFYLDTNRVY